MKTADKVEGRTPHGRRRLAPTTHERALRWGLPGIHAGAATAGTRSGRLGHRIGRAFLCPKT